MTKEEHRKEHEKLHESLDLLMADYISHTKKRLSNSTLMELMQWSHQQTLDPVPQPGTKHDDEPQEGGAVTPTPG